MGISIPRKVNGKRIYTIDCALYDNDSPVGFFLIEFQCDTPPKGDGSDSVVNAQYYFQANWGGRFIPEKETSPISSKS